MMTQTTINFDMNHIASSIFGNYILTHKEVFGTETDQTKQDREKLAQIFQTIDDYVEQA